MKLNISPKNSHLGSKAAVALAKWGMFSLTIALLPLLVTHIMDGESPMTIASFLENSSIRGELLIVATALAGDGLSDVVLMSRAPDLLRILTGGTGVLIVALSCFLVVPIQGEEVASARLISTVQVLFLGSVINCAACKIIATCLEKENVKQSTTSNKSPALVGAGSKSNSSN